jgi:hypothetical protein
MKMYTLPLAALIATLGMFVQSTVAAPSRLNDPLLEPIRALLESSCLM